jgi:hypothetical protein
VHQNFLKSFVKAKLQRSFKTIATKYRQSTEAAAPLTLPARTVMTFLNVVDERANFPGKRFFTFDATLTAKNNERNSKICMVFRLILNKSSILLGLVKN